MSKDASGGCRIESRQSSATAEEIQSVLKDLKWLTGSMKFFGMYYEDPPDDMNEDDDENVKPSKLKCRGHFGEIYCIIITVILWLDMIRVPFMFHPNNRTGVQLFLNLACILWLITCTLMHTNFFVATRNGNFDRVLRDLARWVLASTTKSATDVIKKNKMASPIKNKSDIIETLSQEYQIKSNVLEDNNTDAVDSNNETDSKSKNLILESDISHQMESTDAEDEIMEKKLGCCFRENKTHYDNKISDYNLITKRNLQAELKHCNNPSTAINVQVCNSGLSNEFANKYKIPDSKKSSPRELIKTRATRCAIIAWVIIILNCSFSVYLVFATGTLDVVLSPFGNYLPLKNMIPVRVAYFVLHLLLTGGWAFPPAAAAFIWMSIRHEFEILNKNIGGSLERNMNCQARRGARIRSGDLEDHRIHHDKLTQLSDVADGCTCFCVGASVVGHIGIFILALYVMLWSSGLFDDPLKLISTVFWFITAAANLVAVSTFGMLVNNSAHDASSLLHSLDLMNVDLKTTVQVSVFLSRLYGEAIGFSVLRIFVVDRTTSLTIIGLLITYFLLIIQFSPPGMGSENTTIDNNSTFTTSYP